VARDIPADAFAYWPAGTDVPQPGDLTAVFRKRHGTVTVTWPPPGCSTGRWGVTDCGDDQVTGVRKGTFGCREREGGIG
jgi:hypothetical protein